MPPVPWEGPEPRARGRAPRCVWRGSRGGRFLGGFGFGLLFPFSLEQPCGGPARGGILPRRLRSRPLGPRERRAGAVAQGSERTLGELSLSATSACPPGKGDLGPEGLRAAPGSPSPSCLGDPAASPGVGSLSQPHLRALPAPQLPTPADPCWLAPSPGD